ncbi:hypothetical protein FQR65_LT10700 [Abscondita terminalis]|nr:hypothetical protein FQR65_LT10700 [Abscondita terminalis]
MLKKEPKSGFKLKRFIGKTAVVLIIAETASFFACYGLWAKLNSDREFRNTVRQKIPVVLESYYKFGETIGGGSVREIDYEIWRKEGKIHDN